MSETTRCFVLTVHRGARVEPRRLSGNRYVLGAIAILVVFQLAFTYLPFVNALFGTAPIGASTWALIAVVACCVSWLLEVEKAAVRHAMRRPVGRTAAS